VNLQNKVEDGKFREDLYYRLNSVPIYVPPLRERGKDIELLFRKFASDFAERYKVKPIFLTEEAREVLLKYRFPGNIRQLKNLVDQISVLSTEQKEITGDILRSYLPQDRSLPALYASAANQDISEREILYKVLFEMRRDVNELKRIVLENINNPARAAQLVKENPDLFSDTSAPSKPEEPVLLNLTPSAGVQAESTEEEVQDITHESADDSLSIEKKEKELIMRALRKNNNRRKYAARDLGISERTLYRKIKEYDLED
jgi:DNA-binding NtrC family response regulator